MAGIMNYKESDFSTGSNTDNILCDIIRTDASNMHSKISYTEVTSSGRLLQPSGPPPKDGPPGGGSGGGGAGGMTTVAGVAVSGGIIFNGLAAGNLDAVTEEVETMDKCLSHSSPFGDLHYHSLSPCIKIGSKTEKPALCNSDTDCVDHFNSWSTLGWDNSEDYGGVFGIARDGHVIYGPYNESGELWGCDDHDVCNGFFLADGSYGYASTVTFPYVVGCWGPGP